MRMYAGGVPNAKEINVTQMNDATNDPRRLPAGTLVVSHEDGEPGHIVGVSTFRRNGENAWSYVVDTQYGREVWEVGELFVPAN